MEWSRCYTAVVRLVPDLHLALPFTSGLLQGALVREPGRLLLTDQRLYFQPLHPISGDAAVSSHPLSAVAAAARRRSSLRDLALEVRADQLESAWEQRGRLEVGAELAGHMLRSSAVATRPCMVAQVFFAEPSADGPEGQALAAPPFWAGASALFAFPTREDREQAVNALWAAPVLGSALLGGASAAAACSAILEADPTWLSRVTAAWQVGADAWLGLACSDECSNCLLLPWSACTSHEVVLWRLLCCVHIPRVFCCAVCCCSAASCATWTTSCSSTWPAGARSATCHRWAAAEWRCWLLLPTRHMPLWTLCTK